MSRIYFHSSVHEDAEVRGSERAYMSGMLNDLALGVLGLSGRQYGEHWLKPLFPPSHYVHHQSNFAESASLALTVGFSSDPGLALPDGTVVDPFCLILNTGIALGNEQIQLMARLHGQCEIHCYVTGAKDKTWLAGVIESGLKSAVLRDNQGWESVIELLRQKDDHPVVCSYSVCESFPNYGMLPATHPLKVRTDDNRWDDYYKLPQDEAWELCWSTLKKDKGLRIGKGRNITFGHNLSAFTLRAAAQAASQKSKSTP